MLGRTGARAGWVVAVILSDTGKSGFGVCRKPVAWKQMEGRWGRAVDKVLMGVSEKGKP